ncbi:D-2-hydroxyacid dehydrogenase [Sporolactobacillus sp. CPB3-1]|uniref:D-2-hydroxyacid dehydrogenase n=1 Tax=Sporolactobacillus mangiferae TaxID=2940498 RepID=A0ABT0MCE2_9BACL|nr:D-2-hydroxyacid dehydrogenase [Sporolactobacillus mangiferae]MCL1632541.1 D-2-hydroxyacid dehydrogenase [Sporolactobacillus mangiferae]
MNKIVFGFNEEFFLNEQELHKLEQTTMGQCSFVILQKDKIPDGVSISDAVAFVGAPSDEMLKKMPLLRWLQLPSAGANHFVNHPDLAKSVVLTNSSGVFGVQGAEHTLALILALAREIPLYVKQAQQHLWQQGSKCLSIDGSTATIIGFGDIGSEIAHRLKAFGTRIFAVKRNAGKVPQDADAVFDLDNFDRALNESDIVINVLPLTKETDSVINRERFDSMKRGTLFINVGRGRTVDETALIEALESGNVGGAGLDVTVEEPLPAASRLWGFSNVLITSHSLGVGPGKYQKRAALIERNLKHFILGENLENRVDRSLGY